MQTYVVNSDVPVRFSLPRAHTYMALCPLLSAHRISLDPSLKASAYACAELRSYDHGQAASIVPTCKSAPCSCSNQRRRRYARPEATDREQAASAGAARRACEMETDERAAVGKR
jgi:hypothetical protein